MMARLTRKLQQISDLIEDRRIDASDRAEINDELTTLQRRARRYRNAEEYISHIEAGLGRAQAIRHEETTPQSDATTDVTDWDAIDSIDAVDWRRVALCGCGSPTCSLKCGELPSGCRDRSGGLLDQRSAPERIREYLGSHTQPRALRVAHQTWIEAYAELLADAQDLLSQARRVTPIYGQA